MSELNSARNVSKGQGLSFSTNNELKKDSKFTSGAFWFSLASAASKGMSFIAQVVLGWYLTAEQFGLYAIALSLAAWGLAFRNGGTDQILIQRGREFSAIAPKILCFSLIFNLCSLVVMSSIGWIAATNYGAKELFYMLVIIGIAQVFTSPSVVMRSKLSVDGRYKAFSLVALLSDVSRQCSSILLALLGMGVFAFVIPIALEPLFSALIVYCLVSYRPSIQTISFAFFKQLLSQCKWLMLSNMATALSMSGLFFVASFFFLREEVGLLFFAVQLITAATIPVTNSINNILFSHLSNQVSEDEKMAFVNKTFFVVVGLGALVSFALYIFVEYIIHFIWDGKWDKSIQLAKIYVFTIPSVMLLSFVTTIFSTEARWKQRFYTIAVSVMMDMLVITVVSATEHALDKVLIFVVLSKFVFTVGLIICARRLLVNPSKGACDAV